MPGGYAASASGALARRHPKRALRQRFPIVQKRSLSTLFRGQGLGPKIGCVAGAGVGPPADAPLSDSRL